MRRGRGQWFRSRRRGKPTPGSRLALFTNYSYHAFITDREGDTLDLEADHRRHAEIENAIRDLKYGVGLNHLPSGRFPANAAWLAVQVMAHNLDRCGCGSGAGPPEEQDGGEGYAGDCCYLIHQWASYSPGERPASKPPRLGGASSCRRGQACTLRDRKDDEGHGCNDGTKPSDRVA